MRTRLLFATLLMSVACDPTLDTSTPDTDTGTDTASDSGTASDTGTDSGTATDSGTGTDSGTQGPDITELDPTCHPADPMFVAGFTRTYNVVSDLANSGTTSEGTEVQTGLGPSVAPSGTTVYAVQTALSTTGDAVTATIYQSCFGGVAKVLEWEASITVGGQSKNVKATPSLAREYLPTVAELDAGTTWTYDYQLDIDANLGMPLPITIPTSGTYTALAGKESITVAAGTFDAWKITNVFDQARDSGTMGQFSDISGSAIYWYVEGLGLVKEETLDANTGAVIMTKELASFTGLSPV